MNPITLEWLEKAEGDWDTAGREWRARTRPNFDAVCFHAQQCAEKYLKAILQEAGVPFGKTHNLISLLEPLLSEDPSWEALRLALHQLGTFAVQVRYPGATADKGIARESLSLARQVRSKARSGLGL
jgi:HEPN domain-containing protein